MNRFLSSIGALVLLMFSTDIAAAPLPPPKPYRLPAADLKQRIIWDAQCKEPEGSGLAFGGQDQQANEMRAITRIWRDGGWELLLDEASNREHLEQFRSFISPLDAFHAKQRRNYFSRKQIDSVAYLKYIQKVHATSHFRLSELEKRIAKNIDIKAQINALKWEYMLIWSGEASRVIIEIGMAPKLIESLHQEQLHVNSLEKHLLKNPPTLDAIKDLRKMIGEDPREVANITDGPLKAEVYLDWWTTHTLTNEQEPQPRALAAITYDPKTKLYVMFGGDHLDYLMNDTWVFDMAAKRWILRLPKEAPPPRANHQLIANGDGTITLKGGYTYANNTDYMGGQYIDHNDGDWTYDIAKDEWKGTGKAVPCMTRVYRSGPFHPDYFVQEPKPDPKAFAKWLDDLTANEWTKTNPPHLPHMNRDWGTAVLDPDLILRWSGGHCAHGGTDVLHYHLALNRWELPFPVEFPLGQTYANTAYPEGWNFNKRPWITGHTYQSYAYDAKSQQMIFAGRAKHFYFYDPAKGDWTGTRGYKPKGMSYDSCFYTLTMTPTPHGLVCWAGEGKLFYNEQETLRWVEVQTNGEKLPPAVVDNSTLAYDSQRQRLLFFCKTSGAKTYDGEIYELDWKSLKVRKLAPIGMKQAEAIPYLCQIRYDPENDLMLVGATLPPDENGFRRTPAYDCEKNRWISLRITGDDPSGKTGRNVSLGLVYDPKRNLWWAVDAKSQVYVLKLNPRTADAQPLERKE